MNAVTGMIGGAILAFGIVLLFALIGVNLGPVGAGFITVIGAAVGSNTGKQEEEKAKARAIKQNKSTESD